MWLNLVSNGKQNVCIKSGIYQFEIGQVHKNFFFGTIKTTKLPNIENVDISYYKRLFPA